MRTFALLFVKVFVPIPIVWAAAQSMMHGIYGLGVLGLGFIVLGSLAGWDMRRRDSFASGMDPVDGYSMIRGKAGFLAVDGRPDAPMVPSHTSLATWAFAPFKGLKISQSLFKAVLVDAVGLTAGAAILAGFVVLLAQA